jgi:hypothetical protein
LSTFSAPGTPFHGFDTYSTASFGGYYTQTVPYALPILREYGHDRALFPPWNLRGRRIQLFVRAHEDAPTELRIRFLPPSGDGASAPPPHAKFMSDQGTVVGPVPLQIERSPICPPAEGTAKEGDNDQGSEQFARITIPPEMRGSTVAIVLAYPRGDREIGIRAPVQVDRATKLVYSWDRSLRFERGSAIYFQPARGSSEVAIRATAQFFSSPFMVALLDASDRVLDVRQWLPTAAAQASVVRADVGPEDHQGLVCCLQGLTKYLMLEPESPGIPRYFSDRPERFFVPDARR